MENNTNCNKPNGPIESFPKPPHIPSARNPKPSEYVNNSRNK